jgi:hypothetical protein
MLWKKTKTHAEVTARLPDLQTTKMHPSWVGFVPKDGRKYYYQYSYVNGQFFLEYMLFPEVQLPAEADFREAVAQHELRILTVDLNGDQYLQIPLGSSVVEAITLGMEIVNDAAAIQPHTPVEDMSEGV